MIIYSDIKRYEDVPFGEYLNLPGYSHSFLKREVNGVSEHIETTENMRLGSMVDAILTEPSKVNMTSDMYRAGRDIAARIKAEFGRLIARFKKQVSYAGVLEYESFEMPVKGRLDFLLPGHAVIDLKVTKSKDINSLIKIFGYENQIWNYAKLAGVDKAYLMIYSLPLKQTQVHYFDCSQNINEFWANKILKFGKINQHI